MTAVFFNLLVNSTFSLAAGFFVVVLFLWLFRVETGPWKLFLLSLPFLKIVYDSLRGVPVDSVLMTGLDPFSLPPKHHYLTLNAGISKWGPTLDASFSVQDLNGNRFATSIGDHLTIWINQKFGGEVPLIVLSCALAVAGTLLLLRLIGAYRFEKKRKIDRKDAMTFRIESLWRRKVDIYISEAFSGSPFTGGLSKPYICIPKDAFSGLNATEIESVIAHEMGHVRQFDLVVTIFIQVLGDIFWFVPGYRSLAKKIDRLREVVADQRAVAMGIEPACLASALVKLKEIPETSDRFILYSAFFRERSLLRERVERLLGNHPEKAPRFGWQFKWTRALVSGWIFMAVMLATFGGNHGPVRTENPEWINHWLRLLGLM